ncbi:MAG: hypothetical protein IJX77_00245 [Ruminococcus sp.]|nr:hypothetical protein [Ruminococcus sp.]
MNNNNSVKLVAMIFGIIALSLSVISTVLVCFSAASGWFALFGIILGLIAVIVSAAANKDGAGVGVGGLVMGIVSIVLGLLISVSCLFCEACRYYDIQNAVDHAYQEMIDDLVEDGYI